MQFEKLRFEVIWVYLKVFHGASLLMFCVFFFSALWVIWQQKPILHEQFSSHVRRSDKASELWSFYTSVSKNYAEVWGKSRWRGAFLSTRIVTVKWLCSYTQEAGQHNNSCRTISALDHKGFMKVGCVSSTVVSILRMTCFIPNILLFYWFAHMMMLPSFSSMQKPFLLWKSHQVPLRTFLELWNLLMLYMRIKFNQSSVCRAFWKPLKQWWESFLTCGPQGF